MSGAPGQVVGNSRPARRPQPWPIRLAHWANVPLLAILGGSGLQILAAYPYLGPRGAELEWYPCQGWIPPSGLRLGGWLAGARALHFTFAWLFVLNGLAYVTYLLATGEFRRRWFSPRRDTREALSTMAAYLHLRRPASQGLYNGLQRLAYTSALALGAVLVASGLAIWKPTQLSALAACFGGYDGARAVHLLSLAGMAAFTVGHVAMVLLHPRELPTIFTGGPPHAPPDSTHAT